MQYVRFLANWMFDVINKICCCAWMWQVRCIVVSEYAGPSSMFDQWITNNADANLAFIIISIFVLSMGLLYLYLNFQDLHYSTVESIFFISEFFESFFESVFLGMVINYRFLCNILWSLFFEGEDAVISIISSYVLLWYQ